ncbi:MAG: ABC transporter substrate-binding protein [Solirubrobacterales bacterium]
MRFIGGVLAVGLVAALLLGTSGCGRGTKAETRAEHVPQKPREVDVTLDGYASADNVGILMAEKRGYFEDEGIDIWVRLPGSRLSPLPYVVEREVATAVSHAPQVVMARGKGAPITAFGSLISQPTAAMIWLKKSKIGGIADLKGKTIAITGLPFERGFLEAILARAGLTLDDVKVVRTDYELVPALLSGRADAILGSWNIEGAELEARGLQPVITRVQDLGVPPYEELVLIARNDRLASDPQLARDFMSAVARGTAAAIEDPKAAARVIATHNTDADKAVIEAQLKATLPLLSKSGETDPAATDQLAEWMQEAGMIQEVPPRAAAP